MANKNYSDDEQLDSLAKIWHEYGKYTIISLIVALVAVFGWQSFEKAQIEKKELAGTRFVHLLNLDGQLVAATDEKSRAEGLDAARAAALDLVKAAPSTEYANYSGFFLAKYALQEQKHDDAIIYLDRVIQESKDEATLQLAWLRKAYVLFDSKQNDRATQALAQVKLASFESHKLSLQGDIALISGNESDAHHLYQQALKIARSPFSESLKQKLDDLSHVSLTSTEKE